MMEHDDKVAILLHALGEETVAPALKILDPTKSKAIKARVAELESSPPKLEQIEEVVDDFERFFKFAIEAAGAQNYWSHLTAKINEDVAAQKGAADEDEDPHGLGLTYGGKSLKPVEEEEEDETAEKIKFKVFQPSDDEIEDLNRLHPVQIAEALKGERTKTIAIVLNCLEKDKKAKTIEQVPEELQGELLKLFISDLDIQPQLLRRMIRTVVDKALTIESPEEDSVDPLESVASVMRELPRSTRNNMLNQLRESDEDSANKIQKLMYVFEDIVKYDDKSTQKILAEVDKNQLVIALQPASDEIKDKILENLSKRAKESMQEELELLGKPADAEVKISQDAIAEVISKLDQAEQLELAR